MVHRIFQTIDRDNSGRISFEEFKVGFVEKELLLREDKIREMFSFYDKDQSGTISIEEFSQVFFLKNLSTTFLKKIIEEVDDDGDGQIDYEEFKSMMLNVLRKQSTLKL